MRLGAQNLTDPVASVVKAVAALGAVQAQEYAMARWAVAQRTHGLTAADIDAALASGAIVRTHVMRETWHLIAAPDIRWLLDLTAPRIQARNASMRRRLGLEDELLGRSARVLTEALDGQFLTRRELSGVLAGKRMPAEGVPLAYVLMHAELEGLICSGPLRGRQHTYALLDERVPAAASVDREEALGRLAVRYFQGHGPATTRDLAWWASLTLSEAELAAAVAGEQLQRFVLDQRTYLLHGEPARPGKSAEPAAAPVAHLLGRFDECVVGYSSSRDLLDPSRLCRPAESGPAAHPMLLGTAVAGSWRADGSAALKTLTLKPARELTAAERRACEQAAQDHGSAVGTPVSTVIRKGSGRAS